MAHGGGRFWLGFIAVAMGGAARGQDYSVYKSWRAMDRAEGAVYPEMVRVSATEGYAGFCFFGCQQFDPTDRYALVMRVSFKDREVTPRDVAEIGYYDLAAR